MNTEYVKRFLTKDGNTRISIYQDEYAENPRDTTDEPLHCEDWERNFSIMTKQERDTKSSNALEWIRYMLERCGNTKAIIEVLRNNAKAETHREGDDALVYDASRHEWILKSWIARWTDYSGEIHGNCWCEEASWACRLEVLDAYAIVSYLSEDMIIELADAKYFTDGIKIASYDFGYDGRVSFSDSFSTESDGICWLEKNEFLKYSGQDEDYWNINTLTEIEWLCDEIKAWSEGYVYGFKVEEKHRFKLHKEYIDEDREEEDTEDEEWEETDSCCGFYGDLYKEENLNWILGSAGFKIEELDEVA